MTQLNIQTNDNAVKQTISSVVNSALLHEEELLRTALERTQMRLKEFEKKYSLFSEEFFNQFQSGSLGDTDDYMDWYGEFQLYQVLSRKYSLLKDIVIVG